MTTLLIAEHDNETLSEQTGKAMAAATKLGGDVHVLVAGHNAAAVAEAAAKLDGAAKVLHADAEHLANFRAEPVADLIVGLADGYDAIVAPATTNGKNVLPRVAALLDVMQVSDVTDVLGPDTFERPIYAGNAIQTLKSNDAKKVLTVRTSGFQAVGDGGSAAVETIDAPADPGLSKFVGEEVAHSERPRAHLRQDHHLRRGVRWAPPRSSRSSSCRWPTSSAPLSEPRAPRSMPATRPTTGRSARPARSSPPSSTSPPAFPARSSTWPA